jgi:hypothetical protein
MSTGPETPGFRVATEFAAVDVRRREVPWGVVLELTDARTGLTVRLDALEVEALTSLDRSEREALIYRSAGPLRRGAAPQGPPEEPEEPDEPDEPAER